MAPLVGAASTLPPETTDGRLVLIGGGCYGSYHGRQLARARDRGRIPPQEIVFVDHDPACAARHEFAGRPGFHFVTATWDAFLDSYLVGLGPSTRDLIVPTPLSPHLMFQWLKRRAADPPAAAGAQPPHVVPLTLEPLPATPYAGSGPDGSGFLSFATWTCPVTCYEPALCPWTRGPKAWEMDDAVFAYARARRGAGEPYDLVEVFRCRHYAWGIAAYPARLGVMAAVRLARAQAAAGQDGRPRRLLVATVSSCHGVMSGLELRPRQRSGPGAAPRS